MRKKFLIPVLILLALFVGGILWYTRPQTFWEATGMGRDKITGASGYAIESHVTAGNPSQQTWFMDNLIPGQKDYQALLALLEGTTYRSSLRNLLPPTSSYFADSVTAQASFALGDQLVTVNACHAGKVRIFSSQGERSLLFSVSPRELNETLSDFIQQREVVGNP